MLINILNTILISCGIAANTTNFNYEKKTHRNAENLQINENLYYEIQPRQNIIINEGQPTAQYARRYNISYEDIHDFRYANINETAYTYSYDEGKGNKLIMIVEINNYYNSSLQFRLNTTVNANINHVITKGVKNTTGINMNDYYDMTLTNNAINQIDQITNAAQNINWDNNSTGTDTESSILLLTPTTVLQPRETIQYMFYVDTWETNGTISSIRPEFFSIQGDIIAIDAHTEVVDIPTMMFTILTLPFSFISQAFDLTIFPNTPYQLNFSNLFRTIIAIFVLIWIVKKIIKK